MGGYRHGHNWQQQLLTEAGVRNAGFKTYLSVLGTAEVEGRLRSYLDMQGVVQVGWVPIQGCRGCSCTRSVLGFGVSRDVCNSLLLRLLLQVPALRARVVTLLQRAQLDNDDEVRDRATLYLTQLSGHAGGTAVRMGWRGAGGLAGSTVVCRD